VTRIISARAVPESVAHENNRWKCKRALE